jgi:PAS domain S-box-containing protein
MPTEAEKALSILENAPKAFVGIDRAGNVTHWNQAAVSLFQWSPEEAIGKSLAELIIPERFRAGHGRGIQAAAKMGKIQPRSMDVPAIKRDGGEFTAAMTMFSIEDPEDTGMYAFLEDVTGARDQQKQNRQNEEMYSQILDAVTDMVLVKDREHRIVYANKAFREFYGMSMDELRGIIDSPVNEPGFTEQYLEDDAFVINTGETRNIPEEPVTRHDGKVFLFNTIKSGVVDKNGTVINSVGVSRDITQRKTNEEKIQQLNQDLAHKVEELQNLARKLQTARDEALEASRLKSEFVANISHEIRTPISALIGITELLLDTSLDQEQKDLLELAFESGRSLLTIINDILDFSKIEAAKVRLEDKYFSLVRILSGSVELLSEGALDKNLSISFTYDQSIPQRLMGDPTRLRQILINLVSNAIKFTDQGAIQIRAYVEEQDQWYTRVRFEVQDTGIGVPADAQKRLFLPFMQIDSSTSRKHGGTGLGLAISKRLVELMNGSMGVISEEGSGSTFWFSLPFRLPTEDHTPASQADSWDHQTVSDASTLEHRILLVEDNHALQKLALKQLQRLGYETDVVGTGLEALDAVAKNTYSLILMDCQLPEMDGFDATRRIRENEQLNGLRHTPIIAMTASAMFGDRERCLEAGMDDYIAKPVSIEKLRKIVSRWVSQLAEVGELT